MSFVQDIKKQLSESEFYAQIDRHMEQAHLHRTLASHHHSKATAFNVDDESGRAAHRYHSKKAELHHQAADALEGLSRHMEGH